MADCHSIQRDSTVIGELVPSVQSAQLSSRDVRALLSRIADFYPESAPVADAAARLIIHLETLRHEAIIPVTLGNTDAALRLLKQAAAVEVVHG